MKVLDIFVAMLFVYMLIFSCVGTYFAFFAEKAPVKKEGNEQLIDSLIKNNEELKVEIKYLDSLKNEKVIEVYNLDNDSTVKLFRDLVTGNKK